MPPKQTKVERFERLAQRRVTATLHRIKLVGNLSNRRVYSFSEEHVRQIFDAIETELKHAKSRFRHEGESAVQEFSFRR